MSLHPATDVCNSQFQSTENDEMFVTNSLTQERSFNIQRAGSIHPISDPLLISIEGVVGTCLLGSLTIFAPSALQLC